MEQIRIVKDRPGRAQNKMDMEEPILNAHNKEEYRPAHTGGFDTRRTLTSNVR